MCISIECLLSNKLIIVSPRDMNSRRALISLIETYHELNCSTVDELPTIPTALSFHRYVAKNRPFIVRNGARDWKATRLWNAKYLRETMRSRKVKVAITPLGYV
jgi:jumonji domain-containing protein 7